MIHVTKAFVRLQSSPAGIKGELRYTTLRHSNGKVLVLDQNTEPVTLLLGYRLANRDGEYLEIAIDPKRGRIDATTDFFGSFPGYISTNDDIVIISSDLSLAVKESKAGVDQGKLHQYLTIGFTAFDERTIFEGLEFLPKSSRSSIFFRNGTLVRETWIHEPDEPVKTFGEALDNAYRWRIDKMDEMGIPILVPITAGLDSALVLSNLTHLRKPVETATLGLDNSDDVVVGRKRANACGVSHRHVSLLTDEESRLQELLTRHWELTGGMGPSAEIEYVNFVEACCANRPVGFFIGHGGEFWRMSLKSEEYFSETYLTPASTIATFTVYDDLRPAIVDELFRFGDGNESMHRFYMDDRYPRNVIRKTSIISPYGFIVNPMVDIDLYRIARREFLDFTNDDYMDRLALGDLKFSLRERVSTPYFYVTDFFEHIKTLILPAIEQCEELKRVGVKTDVVCRKVKSREVTDRDVWFICRLANLANFLNSR